MFQDERFQSTKLDQIKEAMQGKVSPVIIYEDEKLITIGQGLESVMIDEKSVRRVYDACARLLKRTEW